MHKLLYHDESECLFWRDVEELTADDLSQCVELGEAPKPKRAIAEFMWSVRPSPKPAFADVYDAKSEKGIGIVQAEAADTGQSAESWLEPPSKVRGLHMPPICMYENLPGLPSEAELKKWSDNGVESSALKAGVWQCPKCGLWHQKVIGIKCMSGTGSSNDKWVHYYQVRAEREKLIPEFKRWVGSELWQAVHGAKQQKDFDLSKYIGKYPRQRRSGAAMEIPEAAEPAKPAVSLPRKAKETLW